MSETRPVVQHEMMITHTGHVMYRKSETGLNFENEPVKVP